MNFDFDMKELKRRRYEYLDEIFDTSTSYIEEQLSMIEILLLTDELNTYCDFMFRIMKTLPKEFRPQTVREAFFFMLLLHQTRKKLLYQSQSFERGDDNESE